MRDFPQTVLYRTRITLSTVEYQINAEYNKGGPIKPIIGHFTSENIFDFDDIAETYLPLYTLISRYYRNAEIGYDTVDEFLLRFNDRWYIALYKIKQLIRETGDFQIGSKGTVTSKTIDKNTLLHGHTDTYKRDGKNATTTNGDSKTQNSVTQLEKAESNGKTETEYGEGATATRVMNGKTDTRDTENTHTSDELSAEDIRQYLNTNFGQLFIEQFHDLFMEVFE